MWPKTTIIASLLLAETAVSQQVVCPSGKDATQLSLPSGTLYAVCQQADLFGPRTIQSLSNITNVADCAQACERAPGCRRAVFDTTILECHLKSNCGGKNTTFVTDSKYATIIKMKYPVVPGESGSEPVPQPSGTTQPSAPAESIGVPGSTTTAPEQSTTAEPPTTPKPSTTLEASTTTQPSSTLETSVIPSATPSGPASPISLLGKWSNVIDFPLIPVAAYIVPAFPVSTRILAFSSWGDRQFGGEGGKTQFADYDYTTTAVSHRTIANTHHDMFCPGMSTLADGRMVVSGGSDAADTSIYDPATNEFTKGEDMKIARGYQSSATLSDGRIFTIGGSYSGGRGGKTGEVYDPATNEWTVVHNADPAPLMTTDHEGIWREDNHAWLFSWKQGSVFQAGPSKAMNWYLLDGQGTVKPAGRRESEMDQMCGINVMYDAVAGKVLSAGGSQDYTNSDATSQAHVITIPQEVGAEAQVEETKGMKFARGFANAVVLPDGQVIVTGGQKKSLVFTDTDGVLEPEMWNPKTGEWSVLAPTPSKIARNYHSVSLLLSDGTVFIGGGGMCYGQKGCDLAKDHLNGEIYSPPYLFSRDGTPAQRPEIKELDKEKVKVGETITVTMDGEADFVLVRMGSATHSINTDQRRVPLADVKKTDGGYAVTLPNDSGVVTPGPWYLFAMSKDGAPSIARTVMIGTA